MDKKQEKIEKKIVSCILYKDHYSFDRNSKRRPCIGRACGIIISEDDESIEIEYINADLTDSKSDFEGISILKKVIVKRWDFELKENEE